METLTLAAIRSSLMLTAVAALSLAYPASVQAVPTTYVYTGNPFTFVTGPYTTSDFVSGMVTSAPPWHRTSTGMSRPRLSHFLMACRQLHRSTRETVASSSPRAPPA
jgi:hypothetical protein